MIIVRAPLRISFAGGGTDIPSYYSSNGGTFLGTGITQYVYVAIQKSFSGSLEVNGLPLADKERINVSLDACSDSKDLQITTWSDLPGGTGLGSSSAFTVALLKALGHSSIAEMACEIEIRRLKQPIGKQDQYLSTYGKLSKWSILPNGLVRREGVYSAYRIEHSLMLFYTGQTRSASSILIKANQDKYTLSKIHALAVPIEEAVMQDDPEKLGELLDLIWTLKKEQASTVSNPDIDKMYKAAKRAGATGGKICGAGGGGFLLLVVKEDKRDRVRQALKKYKEVPVKFDTEGVKVIYRD